MPAMHAARLGTGPVHHSGKLLSRALKCEGLPCASASTKSEWARQLGAESAESAFAEETEETSKKKSAQNLQFKDVQRFADLRCNRNKEICALFWQEIKIDGCQALQKTSRGPAEREALQGLSECLELRTTQTRLERFEAICERFERFAISWQRCWHRFCWQFPFDFCILIV